MDMTYKDIFRYETSWVFTINKLFKKLDSYDWFLETYKYQITVATHQAFEKYLKYKLFEKYKLNEKVDFEEYIYLENYNKLDYLRKTHSLNLIFEKLEDILDVNVVAKYDDLADILSECYIPLRYPGVNYYKKVGDINLKFVKDEIKFINMLYTKEGCSSLIDISDLLKEIKNIKIISPEIKQVSENYSFYQMNNFDK